MQDMGRRALYAGPTPRRRAQQQASYAYLLPGLKIEQPNQVWGVDLTSSRLHSGWRYLFAVLDGYSRFVEKLPDQAAAQC